MCVWGVGGGGGNAYVSHNWECSEVTSTGESSGIVSLARGVTLALSYCTSKYEADFLRVTSFFSRDGDLEDPRRLVLPDFAGLSAAWRLRACYKTTNGTESGKCEHSETSLKTDQTSTNALVCSAVGVSSSSSSGDVGVGDDEDVAGVGAALLA